jgi:hypothetical protein
LSAPTCDCELCRRFLRPIDLTMAITSRRPA